MTNELYSKSTFFGTWLGAVLGVILGAGSGAISGTGNGILTAAIMGLVTGAINGALTGALVVRTAGTTGGVSTGAYTGMAFGAFLGLVFGILLPESFRQGVLALDVLILNVIFSGRFEAAILFSFLFSVLATAVGAWVGGRNLRKRNLA
ncbi:MAG TPA: hypothetical protein PK078_03645 [Anaerolineales bacterium]|nr:hypothetical protein [Anaerolineales bacterium]HNA89219.1 hypothetical protein [Anaerolineales bacterium]HNB35736.1 hypothetical protein [Anaerolineales bacterium]